MIDNSKWFYFAGGKSANSIEELVNALKEMPDDEFVFHVNSAKNDFANWVEGVFEETDLASELRHVMERKDSIRVLEQYLHRNGATHDDEVHATAEVHEKRHKKHSVLGHEAPKMEPEVQMDVQENKHEVTLEEPTVVEDVTDVVEPMQIKSEHDLTDNDLKKIVSETKQELEIEGRRVQDSDTDTSFVGKVSKISGFSQLDSSTQFIIKEFIFGFALGLVFGLIMLGALLNVKCY